MSATYAFDRSRLKLKPLVERQSDLNVSAIKPLSTTNKMFPGLGEVALAIKKAIKNKAPVIMIIGGHVIRSGVQKYIIDMMEKNYVTVIAMNGAGVIHDFELALHGSTTENVARYISNGQFGLWEETSYINDIVSEGWRQDMGLGESVGKVLHESQYPYKDISLLGAGYRLGIPITAHVGIGYDIIFEHPNCDGAAYGETSYRDFLTFAHVVEKMEGGVVMNFGSAVMGPEVFLKALAMARNVTHNDASSISSFTSLVCDIQPASSDFSKEPPKEHPLYYFRPIKTLLVRTVADGGHSYYVQGRHEDTIPALWTELSA